MAGNCDLNNMSRYNGKFEAYQRTYVLTNKAHDRASLDYLWYFLQNSWAKVMLSRMCGTAIPYIKLGMIQKFDISLPPLPAQRKIAKVLSAYDDLIENNTKRIRILERMAEELYKEWFVRRKVGRFETKTLEQIGIRLESGARPKGGVKDLETGVPSVGAENVIGLGKYNFDSEKLIPEEFFAKMRRGKILDRDILLYKDGAYVGRISLFQDGFPHKVAAVNEHVFLLHANEEKLQYFLFFTLAQEQYFKLMQGLNKNAAQPGLNQGAVYGIKVDVPSDAQIRRFDDTVRPLVSEIFSLSKANRNLARQRDLLLPRLMSGKLSMEGVG